MINSRQSFTILLAEDDSDDRDLFREAMRMLGNTFTLVESDDGQATLDFLQTSAILPDMIVLDINMPRMNGINCAKAIRSDARFKDIPVVVMSTSAYETTITEVRNAGATKFAIKPASFDELMAVIRYMCDVDLRETPGDYIINQAVRDQLLPSW